MTADAGTTPTTANLDLLVREIGPMPTHLACGFIQQAAYELANLHAANSAHGSVAPAMMQVGPLVESSRRKPDGSPILRPTPEAKLQLLQAEPRPNATPADDISALASSLCYLLTARENVTGEQLPLLRPDLPRGLLTLIQASLADANGRPNLDGFCQVLTTSQHTAVLPTPPNPETVPAQVTPMLEVNELLDSPPVEVPMGTPLSSDSLERPLVELEAPSQEWVVTPLADPTPSADGFGVATVEEPVKRRRELTPEDTRQQIRFWAKIGIGMWILSIPLWYVFLTTYGCIGSDEKSSTEPTKNRRR